MKKIWIVIVMGLLVTHCRPDIVKIKQATKQTVFPGRKEAPLLLKITVKFKLAEPVHVEAIRFQKKNVSVKVDRFLLGNLDIHRRYKLHKKLPAGNYVFETTMLKKDVNETDKDFMVFSIKVDGRKTYDYKVPLVQGENVYMP